MNWKIVSVAVKVYGGRSGAGRVGEEDADKGAAGSVETGDSEFGAVKATGAAGGGRLSTMPVAAKLMTWPPVIGMLT